jgi:hypothetical protein
VGKKRKKDLTNRFDTYETLPLVECHDMDDSGVPKPSEHQISEAKHWVDENEK